MKILLLQLLPWLMLVDVDSQFLMNLRSTQNSEHMIYEKYPAISGTWFESCTTVTAVRYSPSFTT